MFVVILNFEQARNRTPAPTAQTFIQYRSQLTIFSIGLVPAAAQVEAETEAGGVRGI